MRKNIKGNQRQGRPHLRQRNPTRVRRSTPLVAIFAIFAAFGLCFYGLYWAFESNYSDELTEKQEDKASENIIEKSPFPIAVVSERDVFQRVGFCSYYGTTHSTHPQSSGIHQVSLAEVEGDVESILLMAGLPQKFTIKQSQDTRFASARCVDAPDGLQREILYNPWGLGQVKMLTKNDISVVSILAHEIGHHLSGHTLKSGGSRPKTELEADEYSGHILAQMGHGLEDALAAIKCFPVAASPTHPATVHRIKAIEKGWNKGKARHSSYQSFGQKTNPFVAPGPYFGAGPTLPKTKREAILRQVKFQRTLEAYKYHMETWRRENPNHPKSRNPNWSDADKDRWIRWYNTGRHPVP